MSNRIVSALRQLGPGLVLRGLVLMALLIGIAVLLERFAFEELLAGLEFSGEAGAGWLNGRTAYFVLGALFTAAGGPRQAVSFFAAFFFGLSAGIAIALASTVAGGLVAVLGARLFAGTAGQLIRGRVDIALRIWRENPFGVTLLLRLLPVGSNLFTNLAAGVASIPLAHFVTGSALGYLPQTVVFALMGSGVNIGSRAQVTLSIVLFILSVFIGLWIYARYRKSLKQA